MQIDITLAQAQIELLAAKMGYAAQIEDTSQPLDGDSYPLIDNPISLQQFTSVVINQTLMDMLMNRLRTEVRSSLDNEYNKVVEKLRNGEYDADIATMSASDLFAKILGDMGRQ
jgi:hypothetical protein